MIDTDKYEGHTEGEWRVDDKVGLVRNLFTNVSSKYDLMNDIMSLGIHRIWKRKLIDWMNPKKGDYLIDIASGTGDIAKAFLKRTDYLGTVSYTHLTLPTNREV